MILPHRRKSDYDYKKKVENWLVNHSFSVFFMHEREIWYDIKKLSNNVRHILPRKNMNLPYSIRTAAIKINRPGHSIRMYWTNFWEPTIHLQQKVCKKMKTFFASYLFMRMVNLQEIPFLPFLHSFWSCLHHLARKLL